MIDPLNPLNQGFISTNSFSDRIFLIFWQISFGSKHGILVLNPVPIPVIPLTKTIGIMGT